MLKCVKSKDPVPATSTDRRSIRYPLSPEILELRKGWKRGQAVPTALRERALQLLASGEKPGQVARLIGVTFETIRLWRKAAVTSVPEKTPFANDVGVQGPSDVPPQPISQAVNPPVVSRDSAHGLSAIEQAGILELKKQHPSMGPAQIRIQLKRFHGWRLSVKAIGRLLKQKGYELVHIASRPKGETIIRFEAPHRNALWQMDFVELRVGPERVSLLLVIDDFSRFCVAHELFTEVTSESVVELLKKTIRQHGKPEAMYTDRGGPFLAWRSPSSLELFLETELITHHVGASYHPQGRGKVESLAGTVQRELWQVVHFASVDEARERTRAYFRWYNEKRAHMGIDGLTPADRYFGRWDEVKERVDAASRGRHLALIGTSAGAPCEEVPAVGGPVEVLRLVCADGRLEMRFLGHCVDLGPVQA